MLFLRYNYLRYKPQVFYFHHRLLTETGAFPLLYDIAGNFPCAPNFGPDNNTGSYDFPPHGDTAFEKWRQEEPETGSALLGNPTVLHLDPGKEKPLYYGTLFQQYEGGLFDVGVQSVRASEG